jgi:hypothetical protein
LSTYMHTYLGQVTSPLAGIIVTQQAELVAHMWLPRPLTHL